MKPQVNPGAIVLDEKQGGLVSRLLSGRILSFILWGIWLCILLYFVDTLTLGWVRLLVFGYGNARFLPGIASVFCWILAVVALLDLFIALFQNKYSKPQTDHTLSDNSSKTAANTNETLYCLWRFLFAFTMAVSVLGTFIAINSQNLKMIQWYIKWLFSFLFLPCYFMLASLDQNYNHGLETGTGMMFLCVGVILLLLYLLKMYREKRYIPLFQILFQDLYRMGSVLSQSVRKSFLLFYLEFCLFGFCVFYIIGIACIFGYVYYYTPMTFLIYDGSIQPSLYIILGITIYLLLDLVFYSQQQKRLQRNTITKGETNHD